MKKALVLSTTCISLGLIAGVARADLPVNGCYAADYDAAHLAAHPAQGVAALRLWFHDEVPGQTANRAVAVEAVMADQGQAARDHVGGLSLTQYAYCDAEDSQCGVECDGGSMAVSAGDTGITVATSFFVIGNSDVCGGISDLAETTGQLTRYALAAAPVDACETLWRQHPLPAPGCYGVDYADDTAGQDIEALRLRMFAPDPDLGEAAFALMSGNIGVTLPETGRAAEVGMAGAQVARSVWCSTFDATCRGQLGEGWFLIEPDVAGVRLTIPQFPMAGRGARVFDLASPGGPPAVHLLHEMPDAACRGL